MADLFLSYSRNDESLIATLREDLETIGKNVWLDQVLTGGQAWWDHILENIRGCDCFVFALSTSSLASEACKRESEYAAQLGKPILPVLISDGVPIKLLPQHLSTIHHVDYRGQDKSAFIKLSQALESLPDTPSMPEMLPAEPSVPLSYLSDLSERVAVEANLSVEQQSVLLVDLKAGLRTGEDLEEVRQLLRQFRQRGDVLASIAQEIDHELTVKKPRTHSARTSPVEKAKPEGVVSTDIVYDKSPITSGKLIATQDSNTEVTSLLKHVLESNESWEVRADAHTRVVLAIQGSECTASTRYQALVDFKSNKLRKAGWKLDYLYFANVFIATMVTGLTFGVALLSERIRYQLVHKRMRRSWRLTDDASTLAAVATDIRTALDMLTPAAERYELRKHAGQSESDRQFNLLGVGLK